MHSISRGVVSSFLLNYIHIEAPVAQKFQLPHPAPIFQMHRNRFPPSPKPKKSPESSIHLAGEELHAIQRHVALSNRAWLAWKYPKRRFR